MNIVPSSTIHLLKNVPLNNSYDDTIQFSTRERQITYFGRAELHVKSFTAQSYQRYAKGVLRVDCLADDLYECNYMCFQNTGHSSNPKWFYAFITSVDYVNENSTAITYEIDVLQTFLFDVEVGMCYVEREHTGRDLIGDNIVEENLALGEYVYDNYTDIDTYFPGSVIGRFKDYCVIIMTCSVYTGSVEANVYDNVVQGATLYAYDYDSQHINDLKNFIASYAQVPEELVAMYMCPKALVGEIPANHIIGRGRTGWSQWFKFSALQGNREENPTTFGSFVPKNNKLYTYPFTYFHIDNSSGDEMRLRYEFFENGEPVIECKGTLSPPVQVVARPASYKGLKYVEGSGYKSLFTQSLVLQNYPMCSWSTDYYHTWLAQNAVPMGLSMISKLVPAVGLSESSGISSSEIKHGFSTKNSINLPYWKTNRVTNDVTTSGGSANYSVGTGDLVSSAFKIASDMYTAHHHSDDMRGEKYVSNVNVANNTLTYFVGRARITEQYARIIDNYFNMFGYAVRRVKVPNIFNPNENDRPHWNFVKTANCVLSKSNCPTDVANAIISIFNNGITFWKDADEIGNYSLDNRPQ